MLPVDWTVAIQGGRGTTGKQPLVENPNWAKGFDIVVHNQCFADTTDEALIKRITSAHKGGPPAIVIHCAMHTYRASTNDTWREFLGGRPLADKFYFGNQIDVKTPPHLAPGHLHQLPHVDSFGAAEIDDEVGMALGDLRLADTMTFQPSRFDQSAGEIAGRIAKHRPRVGKTRRLAAFPFPHQFA